MIVIVDYGCGNLGSIKNMLKKAGHESLISSTKEDIQKADKLILPGVGAFDTGIRNLKEAGLFDLLNKKVVQDKTIVLGICLGMQLMAKRSEEGKEQGFGWVDAEVVKFIPGEEKLKIPNMGWNEIKIKKENKLLTELSEPQRFYFVHSYYVKCANSEDVIATAEFGTEYVCAFGKQNIFGVQFHPEKSHRYGLQLLKNFAQL